ncbi:MAG TPA: hypothetical protein VK067_08910 [Pseudogracilibacillus sp.]|nr:hypothetical protein [Pseudogracilibacillus sp.]
MDVNPKKFLGYQIIAIIIIWAGMTFFLDKIAGNARIVYYVVTSWLLFLIVLFIKNLFTKSNKGEVIPINKEKEDKR